MTERIADVQVRDIQSLQQGLENYSRKLKENAEGDVVIEMPRRLYLRDTDGIYWRIGISTAGVLTATSVGASLP